MTSTPKIAHGAQPRLSLDESTNVDSNSLESGSTVPASSPVRTSGAASPTAPSLGASLIGGQAKRKPKPRKGSKAGTQPNNVRKLRQAAMMSKAELARRAGVSPLTIDRVEAGCPCRMDTKRKILEALGLSPSARAEVWPDIDSQN
ncbi:MAG: helix-turn-helix transcriptional regulator [Nannocystaceae bacterium]